MAERSGGGEGVLVQVCLQCGKQYTFDTGEAPAELSCEKCGSEVFRSFFASPAGDEVDAEFRESTERDTLPTDPGTDVTQGDLHDLSNG